MARKKLYYPATDIEANLHASANMFTTETGDPYVGQYHRYKCTGEYYSSGKWDIKTSVKLIPTQLDVLEQVKLYKTLKTIQTKFISPKPAVIRVTPADIKQGYITRHILIKHNDVLAIEVDSEQYKSWQQKKIDNNMYTGYAVTWWITGELVTTNKNGVVYESIIDKNRKIYNRLLTVNTTLAMHFTNPLQFYVDTSIVIPPNIN